MTQHLPVCYRHDIRMLVSDIVSDIVFFFHDIGNLPILRPSRKGKSEISDPISSICPDIGTKNRYHARQERVAIRRPDIMYDIGYFVTISCVFDMILGMILGTILITISGTMY
jgi:hypothetical protein